MRAAPSYRPLAPLAVGAAALLGGGAAATPVENMQICQSIASGIKTVAEAMMAEDMTKARIRLIAAERVYFEDKVAVFSEAERPNADAVFAEAGMDLETLLTEVRACLNDGDCAEGLTERVALVNEGLRPTCQRDMMEEMN